jgi:hypothetical protein
MRKEEEPTGPRGPISIVWWSKDGEPEPQPHGRGDLERRLESIRTGSYDALSRLDAPPADPLYHYARPEVVQQIIATQRLWATHASYLNDSSELVYADRIVAKAAEELLTKAQSNASKELLTVLARMGERKSDLERHGTGSNSVYVACFSEDRDVLSQWRAYANDGLGYALGFDPKGAYTVERQDDLPVSLVRVRYVESEQVALVLPRIEEVVAAVDELVTCKDENEIALVVNLGKATLRATLDPLSVAIKNPGFREEQEWRLVANAWHWPTQAEFRPSKFGFSPYVKLTPVGGSLPLKAVVCGPKLHSPEAYWSTKTFLLRNGYGDNAGDPNYVALYGSEATYRG